jgi:putative ABC transport system permease protein
VNGTLLRAGLRHLGRHPWQTGLSVLGIALGVAVVVAVDLAQGSARRAFELSAEAVTGRATHQVVGGPAGLDEGVFVRLVREAGARPAAPVVEADVGAPDHPGRALRLLGVDPLAEGPFRPFLRRAGGSPLEDLRALLTEPGAVLLAEGTAADLGLAPGAALRLKVGARRRTVRVAGLLAPADAASRAALDGLVVADVATAQEVLDRPGRLSRVDLRVPPGAEGAALLARVRAVLPPGAAVEPAAARTAFVEGITRAFSVNLTALSLLAVVVGMFLIYNTATFSVVQRRPTLGVLRALGVGRGEILGLLLAEAAAVGLAASAAGLGLGVVLGRGLVRLVTRTINDLYFVLSVRDLALDPGALVRGLALGLGATLLATLVPALDATREPPGPSASRAALEARRRRGLPRAALAGVAALAGAGGLLAAPGGGLGTGYAGLFALVLGAALLAPAATALLAAGLEPVLGRLLGLPGRMAARDAGAALSRTGVAVAALTVAVAAAVGVGLMVASFRGTVERWLEASLVADVYVSAPSLPGRLADSTLDPRVVPRLVATPGVAAAGTYRGVRVQSAVGPVQLVALALAPGGERQFRLLAGRPAAVWPAFREGGAAIVSEPFAYRHGLAVGSRLALRTDRGERALPVAGIFADYGSDQGVMMVSRRTYEALWDDRGISSLGLLAAPGTDAAALVAAIRERAGPEQELLVRDGRALRRASLEIFDRTFAITAVLRVLTTGVAFVGVLSALMALQLERARELGVLRAQGLGPGQVWGLVTAHTGLLGLAAGLLAVPTGVALALVLVHVINRRSFGWTLEAAVEPGLLLQAVGAALAAALAAGAYPGYRMARTPPAAALREE